MSRFFNPPMTWSELERRLSPASSGGETPAPWRDGSDAQAWGRPKRGYEPDEALLAARPQSGTPYAELHAQSHFSFLHGSASPEELVEEACLRGLHTMALTDHDGLYGAVRFSEAAERLEIGTVFGASLAVEGARLPLLCRNVSGYRSLSAAITRAQLAGGKGEIRCTLEELASWSGGEWQVLTGGLDGPLHAHLDDDDGGLSFLGRLVAEFGAEHVEVELVRHGLPDDDERIRHLAALAARLRLPVLATNAVRYARPAQMPLAQALAAVSRRSSVERIAGELPAAARAMVRSGQEMAELFAEHPHAVARAAALGEQLAFKLSLAEPELPRPPVEEGADFAAVLRRHAWAGTDEKYGGRPVRERAKAERQVARELAAIERMGFCGYFLIVHEIAQFCREEGIFCQGRGSAANSAVCYVLDITAVDAVKENLVFERFLAPERDGYPDIDLDIESSRRERVIQHVYGLYGRDRAAQVANVITYRARSAVRDMARALGYAPGQQDAWAKQVERWSALPDPEVDAEDPVAAEIPAQVLGLARGLLDAPRHLGIHSGGMVLCDRPVAEVVPVEWARMEDRSVVQWDKDDCATMKLVKFDLLGLGMLGALHEMVDLVQEHHGVGVDRSLLDREDARVYDMLCAGDAVGVFQVESRAQLATLPRLKPRRIYELAVQVAIIRPGPIQGGSVHPYIRRKEHWDRLRRAGVPEKEAAKDPAFAPPHPLLGDTLGKTLGVPLFQEQLMQMAMVIADFNGGDADELRRAMSAKRSQARMRNLQEKFFAGTDANGVPRTVAVDIYEKIEAFANYGFPESHAISFAALVFDSAWFKCYFPAAFCVALLRSQPMGFYSPQSLIADARRHDVEIRGVDINASQVEADLEPIAPVQLEGVPQEPVETDAVRLGLRAVRQLGEERAEEIVRAREDGGPFSSVEDLCHRVELSQPSLDALATAGAFDSLGVSRREALWTAGAMAGVGPGTLPEVHSGASAPVLPEMSGFEQTLGELWATGVTSAGYPTAHLRAQLRARGICSIADLAGLPDGRRTVVAGLVTHRQRPATASGITFMNLEDEFGMLNVVCSAGLWRRYRRAALRASAVAVHGRVQRADAVISFLAERLEPLRTPLAVPARDFR